MSLAIRKQVISYEYDSFRNNLEQLREQKGQEWIIEKCDIIIDEWSKQEDVRRSDSVGVNSVRICKPKFTNKTRSRTIKV